MNKQELIDKAVHEFGGEWPSVFNRPEKRSPKNGFYVTPSGTMTHKDHCEWLKECEFTQRARELGYINGYRWGVEYPTGGKRPDLAYDVVVDIRISELDVLSGDECVSEWDWDVVLSFRITDQRYKPSDTSYLDAPTVKESLTDEWYDYDNQKAIALPPVGVECEVNSSIGWVECSILAMGSCKDNGSTLFWQAKHDCGAYYSVSKFRPLDHNRKAEAEKKRVVDAAMAMAVDTHMLEDILGSLYDAGYLKLPAE